MQPQQLRAAVVRQALAGPAVPEPTLGAPQLRLLTHYVLGYLSRRQTNALLRLGGSLLRLGKPETSSVRQVKGQLLELV